MTKTVIKAPENIFRDNNIDDVLIFLGGSIEMGKAEKWQDRLTDDIVSYNVTILNPRRDDWDSSWVQDPSEGTKFHEQVSWEMYAQENSDVLVYYFAANTMSPITLLEMGAYGEAHDTIVYVDPNYDRRGNVIMYCNRYGIQWVDNYDELVTFLNDRVLNR